jgi:release factor glutamine methyltransferase
MAEQSVHSPETEWTIARLLTWTGDYFKAKGLDDPLLSAQLLLAKVLSCSKMDLYLRYDQGVSPVQREEYRHLVKRAADGEPIAYLIGHKEFFSLEFGVTSAVLIPRPETELLVQWVIRTVRSDYPAQAEPLQILDVGTGSGCIAVALARFLPRPVHIVAADKYPKALETAKINVERHKVQDTVALKESDLFRAITERKFYDFIVSNPPYVTEEDYTGLPKSIKDYEPAEALLGGPDGLAVIRTLIAQAGGFLKSDGYLAMEIGYNQRDAVERLLADHGFAEVTFEKDAADIPRIAIGKKGTE